MMHDFMGGSGKKALKDVKCSNQYSRRDVGTRTRFDSTARPPEAVFFSSCRCNKHHQKKAENKQTKTGTSYIY